MTGTYNRISRNRTLIPFFVVALLLHVVFFRVPVKTQIASRLGQAISVSVVPSKEPASVAPPVREATKSLMKSAARPKLTSPPVPKAAPKRMT